MINYHCDICDQNIDKEVWVVRLSDDKESVEYNAHKSCANELFSEIKNIKDIHKIPVQKVLNILNLRR